MTRSCGARGVRRRVPVTDGIRLRVVSHARMENEQEFTCRAVGAVDDETPAPEIGLGTDRRAVTRDDGLVIAAPSFGAPSGYGTRTFWFNEFDTARIGKTFFRRVDSLHQVAMRSRCGELGNGGADFADRRPQIRQHYNFRQWRRHE